MSIAGLLLCENYIEAETIQYGKTPTEFAGETAGESFRSRSRTKDNTPNNRVHTSSSSGSITVAAGDLLRPVPHVSDLRWVVTAPVGGDGDGAEFAGETAGESFRSRSRTKDNTPNNRVHTSSSSGSITVAAGDLLRPVPHVSDLRWVVTAPVGGDGDGAEFAGETAGESFRSRSRTKDNTPNNRVHTSSSSGSITVAAGDLLRPVPHVSDLRWVVTAPVGGDGDGAEFAGETAGESFRSRSRTKDNTPNNRVHTSSSSGSITVAAGDLLRPVPHVFRSTMGGDGAGGW
ncbi:hypothetical protein L1987_58847 [Smallanthus sonchifolius]|uniref:Uncharacterized protein n=1 Tax=Smallanthus sonchifolius TaxID=185202 RepID=A0ACB9D3T0_9ASTR|nr:hypothetical protein L1987_58847 [Smallanthus sonchifolius]